MDHRVLFMLLSLCSPVIPDKWLVGGATYCSGRLKKEEGTSTREDKHENLQLRTAAEVCIKLDCGSVVSLLITKRTFLSDNTNHEPYVFLRYNSIDVNITCSESVRLVNGTDLCSGRLEVKFDQSWSSVCEDNFDQREREVVCRELGCGPPSVFQLVWYRETSVWTKEFHCGGNESHLLECGSLSPVRKTCPSGNAVGLTCTDPDDVRLVGGDNKCTGTLELKHKGLWRPAYHANLKWDLKTAEFICKQLGCGSAISTTEISSKVKPVWLLYSSCIKSKYPMRECVKMNENESRANNLTIACSESVRLLNGTDLCSGILEVKFGQSWSLVCEDSFDEKVAQVVCRELGCGPPVIVRGGLYEEVAPVLGAYFWCKGNESRLLECLISGSPQKACSNNKVLRLTCSDRYGIRLVGEASRCAGSLEMKHQGIWKPLADWESKWDQVSAATVCRELDCGYIISTAIKDEVSDRPVWWIKSSCVLSASELYDCLLETLTFNGPTNLEVICSGSQAKDGVFRVLLDSSFTIICSAESQFEGGSFHLIFNNSDGVQNLTLLAVNHSAHFLFFAADYTHEGNYRCVHHLYAFANFFSAESLPLYVTVAASVTHMIIRLVMLLLGVLLLITAVCITSKTSGHRNVG
ncbi:scavenger receptor cysteine-rich type 1 protein M130-like isoform X2 [Echeneis naucrates]|uniref:scavenger receptor cysteine-rich type 1 protein M130-like isoform X2 n=1 Tax=Echeneis naucrates TaxID=173247 RepID=UPI0011144848|nr:scavenger receptor cysteine-rich type 1 protein M130-like isoform X2 [Echeneis naucrates]